MPQLPPLCRDAQSRRGGHFRAVLVYTYTRRGQGLTSFAVPPSCAPTLAQAHSLSVCSSLITEPPPPPPIPTSPNHLAKAPPTHSPAQRASPGRGHHGDHEPHGPLEDGPLRHQDTPRGRPGGVQVRVCRQGRAVENVFRVSEKKCATTECDMATNLCKATPARSRSAPARVSSKPPFRNVSARVLSHPAFAAMPLQLDAPVVRRRLMAHPASWSAPSTPLPARPARRRRGPPPPRPASSCHPARPRPSPAASRCLQHPPSVALKCAACRSLCVCEDLPDDAGLPRLRPRAPSTYQRATRRCHPLPAHGLPEATSPPPTHLTQLTSSPIADHARRRRSTATRQLPRSPTPCPTSRSSTPSRPPPSWASWWISGRPRAAPTSLATR